MDYRMMKHVPTHRLWLLLVSEEAMNNVNDDDRAKFAGLLRLCVEDSGWTYEECLGDIIWYYPILGKDTYDILIKLQEKLREVRNSRLKLIAIVDKEGNVQTA